MRNSNESGAPVLGKPQKMKDGSYFVKNKAIIGQVYTIVCPECSHSFLIKAQSTKAHKGVCKKCGKTIFYLGKEDVQQEQEQEQEIHKEQPKPSGSSQTHKYKVKDTQDANIQDCPDTTKHGKPNAKLEWGGLFHKNTYVFKHIGKYFIGRDDDEIKSDIMVKDDYVSRRSVLIDVVAKSGTLDCNYKLTVKNATNPVMVNAQIIEIGESIYLNYGDTILLGNTTLTFKQNKK